MTILLVGASGATGQLLVKQLLDRGHNVRVIVRSPEKFNSLIKSNDNLSVIGASVLGLSDQELAQHVSGCDAVASCLGHNMSLKGIWGPPRRLVTDTTRRLCKAVKTNKSVTTTKYVLMNTVGNQNRDLNEPISFIQRCVLGLLRLTIPPHPDNEQAADYLRIDIGQNDSAIEWTAVRPSALINEENVTGYKAHPSPMRNAITNDGQISRINVAHFMADLITDDEIWIKWKGQMPVIYNESISE